MKRWLLLILAAAGMIGCGLTVSANGHDADIKAIQALEVDWVAALSAKDLDQTMNFYADDAIVLAPNVAAMDKPGARAMLERLMGDPNFALHFSAAQINVARSGDLAYSEGAYTLTGSNAAGKAATTAGRYVTVFAKQDDGSWKVMVDSIDHGALDHTAAAVR